MHCIVIEAVIHIYSMVTLYLRSFSMHSDISICHLTADLVEN